MLVTKLGSNERDGAATIFLFFSESVPYSAYHCSGKGK